MTTCTNLTFHIGVELLYWNSRATKCAKQWAYNQLMPINNLYWSYEWWSTIEKKTNGEQFWVKVQNMVRALADTMNQHRAWLSRSEVQDTKHGLYGMARLDVPKKGVSNHFMDMVYGNGSLSLTPLETISCLNFRREKICSSNKIIDHKKTHWTILKHHSKKFHGHFIELRRGPSLQKLNQWTADISGSAL